MAVNGYHHHNVEDILASIRTSIADESGTRHITGELHAPQQQIPRRDPPQDVDPPDDSMDFELPAIFKPGHQAPIERPKLLGRLSEALMASNAAEASRPRTVIPFDPSANGRVIDPQQALQAATVKTVAPAIVPQAPVEATANSLKHDMPTFLDTRINRLGDWSREASTPKALEPLQAPVQQFVRQPPTLPHGNLMQVPAEAVDDAAAQLLRPMLKQWLQENMPKIVEKALLSEVQGDLPPLGTGKRER